MAVQFATIDEFRLFQGLPAREPRPADSEEALVYDAETTRLNALLQRASGRVSSITRLARVSYARTGIPAVANIADAFSRATSAQATWFEDKGSAAGSGAEYDSVSLIGVSFSRRAGVAQTPAQTRVSPEALEILSNAGIFSTAVSH